MQSTANSAVITSMFCEFAADAVAGLATAWTATLALGDGRFLAAGFLAAGFLAFVGIFSPLEFKARYPYGNLLTLNRQQKTFAKAWQ